MSLKLLGYEAYNEGTQDLEMTWRDFFADEGPAIERLCKHLVNHLGA